MAKLTLARPTVGEKNTSAEPKVDTALANIENWANGEVGTGNIEANSVTEAMLVTAVQEKLGGTIFGLAHKASAISASVANGELLEMTGTTTTATLPTATKGRVCGVYAAAAGIKIKTAAGVIAGDFITGQATIQLELNQHVVLEAEGTNWRIIAGEPKREQTYSAEASATSEIENETSATRPALVVGRTFGSSTAQGEVFVGGVKITTADNVGGSIPITFLVPPGVKWKVTLTGASAQFRYSALLL